MSTPQTVTNRRQHRRQAADGPGRLAHKFDETLVELVDLSYGGARVVCPQGLVPQIGEAVRIDFLDGSSIFGRVAWLDSQHIGLRFNAMVADIHDRPDGTSDGKELFTRIIALQFERQSR